MDANFSGNIQASLKNKWQKRIDFLDKQFSSDECMLSDGIMCDYLQNIWYKTFVTLFQCFSISQSAVGDSRHIFYIDELVEKRNAIAHGRMSPIEASAGMRSNDLELRFIEITNVITYMYDCFDNFVTNREFVAAAHR